MSSLAKAKARKLLEDYCISSPAELDLTEIAYGEKLYIQEQPLQSHIGRINYRNGFGIITLSSLIIEESQKRFIIAHEFGHYYNERNKLGLNGCTNDDLFGLKVKKEIEAEANAFAGELLMPEQWFKDFTKGKKFSYRLLTNTAKCFGVSLSAAALKYSEIGAYPTAIIMSENGKVKWSRINKYFPFQWIPVGYEVNNNSYAYDIFENYKRKDAGGKMENVKSEGHELPITDAPCEVLADAWFWNDQNYKKNYFMMEYNIPMPRYNAVLTVLWEK